nr:MAG TPA: portal protein [Caudoviricetes sp.]
MQTEQMQTTMQNDTASGLTARKPIGEEQARKAMDTLQKYRQGKSALEARVIASEDWWRMRSWQRIQKGNPEDDKWTSAWLFNVIMGKHADAIAAYPAPAIRPREPDDREEAAKLSSVLPVILEQNDFEEVYSDSQWTKLKQGTLIWHVKWDSSKLNGLGDISVQPVDILSFFWEPGVRDIQKSKNIFLTEMVDNDLLLAKYPELEGKLNSSAQLQQKYNTDDVISFDGKSMVVDWYYKKYQDGRQVLHFAKLVGDTVLQSTENDTEQKYDTLTMPDGSIVQQPAGRPMAETGLYDDGEYPFVIDALFPVEGSIAGYGYIDIGKSTQEQIDRMNQAIVKNAIMSTTPRWFKRSDGSVNEQEFADWTKPFVHVDGNLGQDSLVPIQVNMLNSNYIAILQNKIEELKWTTGNTDVNNGATNSGVTAASAIAALQEASGRSSKDSTKSAYRAYARMIRMVIERIRQFYDLPRQFRIVGQRGAEQFVQYSNQGLQPQTLYGANGQPDGLRKPVFDIEVSAQKASEYTSMAQNELALQFFQLGFFNPQMVDQALATLDMMDFDGKDSIIQKIQENADLQQRLVQWQQLALALADRYDPVMGEGLAQQILQEGGQAVPQASAATAEKPEISTGEAQEPKIVENARKKSEESTQPG